MKNRGVISFVFDDGYQQVFTQVPPMLESHGFQGVFAVALNHKNIENTEERPVQPWSDWISLQDRGHEIAAHSVNHLNLTTLSRDVLDWELREPQQKLNATTLVYPGGAYNPTVAAAARKYYTAARTVVRGFETLPAHDPMALKSFNWTRQNFSVTKANALTLWASLTNSWLIETYHMIDDNDASLVHSVRASDLDKHLQFVAKMPIHVCTIQTALSRP